jgi:hypothetical protein
MKQVVLKEVVLKEETRRLLEDYLELTGQRDAAAVVDEVLRSYLEDALVEKAWHDADLSRLGDYEPYDRGDTDPETVGKPISYEAGKGFIVHE